jgi:hypothetical protein
MADPDWEGSAMTVQPATLTRSPAGDASEWYSPPGEYRRHEHRGRIEDSDYVEEEWFATGEADGEPYATQLIVRRPRDKARFSGTVIAEPLHSMGASPVWMYTSAEVMRQGHISAVIASQKSALDMHVKSFNPSRYEQLHVEADPPAADAPELDVFNLPVRDPARMAAFNEEMQRLNKASNAILAQVGAAIAQSAGPFEGWNVAHVILAGHSQTGGVVTNYIRNAHQSIRRDDGSSVFDGYFPAGSPSDPFDAYEVPILQLLSEGDISDPNRAGRENRKYRRADSDKPGDRFTLYELAGVAHMGTRYAPYNDPGMWQQAPTAGNVPTEQRMSSLPHNELFDMGLRHLVNWVVEGVTPPTADRIEVGADGYFAKDEHGNSLGGIRCVYLDVPKARYYANPRNENGTPAMGVVGSEELFDKEELGALYKDHSDYVERFNRRLDELINQGWFLADNAPELREDAEAAPVP